MSKVTKRDLIEAIDDVLSGRPVLKWDYFVSVKCNDVDVQGWIRQMRDLDENYSDRMRGRMLTDKGIEKLRKLRSELER